MIPVFTPSQLSSTVLYYTPLVNVLGSGQLGQQWGTGWDGFIEASPAHTIPLCPATLAPPFIEGVKEAGSPLAGEKCLFLAQIFWPTSPLFASESSRHAIPH